MKSILTIIFIIIISVIAIFFLLGREEKTTIPVIQDDVEEPYKIDRRPVEKGKDKG